MCGSNEHHSPPMFIQNIKSWLSAECLCYDDVLWWYDHECDTGSCRGDSVQGALLCTTHQSQDKCQGNFH